MKLPLLALTCAALVLPATVRTSQAKESEHLSQAETQLILEHAVARAEKIDNHAIICICDREGFILALWDVGNKLPGVLPALPPALPLVLEQPAVIPLLKTYGLAAAAVNRAVSAAYLSSNQNAFTPRTAGFIIEQHFPPGIKFTPPGPLLGVGFSSLFYTDVNRAKVIPTTFNGQPFAGNLAIPANQQANNSEGVRTPGFLLSSLDASPGGVPLYKNGELVGGIGVTGDGDPTDLCAAAAILFKQTRKDTFIGYKTGRDLDEDVALAGQTNFRPDNSILATAATIAGIRPLYVYETASQIRQTDETERANLGLPGQAAFNGGHGHQVDIPYGDYSLFLDTDHKVAAPPVVPAGVASGFPQASPLDYPHEYTNLGEVDGSIRFPLRADPLLNDPLRGHIGNASRLTREDVVQIISQSARRANTIRAGIRLPIGTTVKTFVTVIANPNRAGDPAPILGVFQIGEATLFSWDVAVQKARTALYFSQRQLAMSCTAVGWLAARFYPPGLDGRPSGPLFGFQEAITLRRNAMGQFPGNSNLPNGITIFPGGFPLYRSGELIGAVGVSGDGVTQDDLISSSGGVHFQPPKNIRSDTFEYRGARLPYVKFPRDPED
jgi:uncharacterized protein GlcG (DUF336 family)